MNFKDSVAAGRTRIAEITRTMDPALVVPAAREAARLVQAYRAFSTRPIVPGGVPYKVQEGEGDARILTSAALAISINADFEHVDQVMNHMAKLLEVVANEHVELARQVVDVLTSVARVFDNGRSVKLEGHPAYFVERLVTKMLADAPTGPDMDPKPLALLLDSLVQAGFDDEGGRLCRAVDKMGKVVVGKFYNLLQPGTRTWLGRYVMRANAPPVALAA